MTSGSTAAGWASSSPRAARASAIRIVPRPTSGASSRATQRRQSGRRVADGLPGDVLPRLVEPELAVVVEQALNTHQLALSEFGAEDFGVLDGLSDHAGDPLAEPFPVFVR